MTNKEKLLLLIEAIPESQIPAILELLRSHVKAPAVQAEAQAAPAPVASMELDSFLKVLVTSLNNTLFDLSAEYERNESKVTAKRLDFSRKRIIDAWEGYTAVKPEE